ncbi:MAG: hypothetical protein WDM91_12880 [Rhizomicrobium sp.]
MPGRMLLIAILAACSVTAAAAHDGCRCREPLVLNGRLQTANFDGGVGDRYGDSGYVYGGTTVVVGGNASAGGSGTAFAAARASAFAHAGGFHGGHGGGGHR